MIKEAVGIRDVHAANCGNEIINSREDLHSQNNKSENNVADKYYSNKLNKGSDSGDSDSNSDIISKTNRNYH